MDAPVRPGQLLYTATRATCAINNVAGSRHKGKDEAENHVFKVDFTSVNIYHTASVVESN